MLDIYEKLQQQIAEVEQDVRKAAGGNRAAGTRVRKAMQEIKATAQDLRTKVLEAREEEH
ncbi:MAG: histone H1 [Phycisphaeraceae bacterium]|nr:histone H1 [Phycisphaeraceae bacterium]|tara:strand:- start:172 stop:351 length:180 start_codon:yes stop_codon:yes gene_type:complete